MMNDDDDGGAYDDDDDDDDDGMMMTLFVMIMMQLDLALRDTVHMVMKILKASPIERRIAKIT